MVLGNYFLLAASTMEVTESDSGEVVKKGVKASKEEEYWEFAGSTEPVSEEIGEDDIFVEPWLRGEVTLRTES